ncbi:MAG: hypothetical protein ABIL18_02540, partial [candidate division WOR-3 bacterium]
DDADLLRRAMTKERGSNLMNEIKEKFFIESAKLGYSKKEIERVWQRISAFSSFGFNKAHSLTYATLAYLSAYQKFYAPLEFFCRLLNNEGGYYPVYAYINEARRWGIKIIGPDINRSEYGFSIKDGSLVVGLCRIRNLSHTTIKKILKFRPFQNSEKFYSFVKPDIEEGTNLIKSGAMDLLGKSWTELYFRLLRFLYQNNQKKSTGQEIFIKEEWSDKEFNDFNQQLKLKSQFNVLGFLPMMHILEFLYPERQIKISDIRSIQHLNSLTGLMIAKRTILTRTKKYMSFYTVDDETGFLEVVMFERPREESEPILQIKGYLKDDLFYARPV